jgi:hypothetical protein
MGVRLKSFVSKDIEVDFPQFGVLRDGERFVWHDRRNPFSCVRPPPLWAGKRPAVCNIT